MNTEQLNNEIIETEQTTQEIIPVEEEEKKEDTQEAYASDTSEQRNWKELRSQKQRLEKERDELRQRLEEIEARKQQVTPDEPSLNDDDLVEWKYVKKELNRLRGEIDSYKQHTTQSSAEMRLKSKYSDFDRVVNTENIEMLKDMYPEIAQSLAANPDIYSKGAAVYDVIKRYGIYREDTSSNNREIAQKNSTKPRSINSISPQQGNSPLDHANAFAQGMTPDLQKKLLEEMDQAIKNY